MQRELLKPAQFVAQNYEKYSNIIGKEVIEFNHVSLSIIFVIFYAVRSAQACKTCSTEL